MLANNRNRLFILIGGGVAVFVVVFSLVLVALGSRRGAPESPTSEPIGATSTITPISFATRTPQTGLPTAIPTLITVPTSGFIVPTAVLPPTRIAGIPTGTPLPLSIGIISPAPGNLVAGTVQVIGAATHPQFLQYILEFGPEPNPSNLWYPITPPVTTPLLNGVLGIWGTNTLNDANYQLRLRVFLRDGSVLISTVNGLRVQNRLPTAVPTSTPITLPPIANFVADRYTGTAPLQVRFTNLTAGIFSSSFWNFGDGGTSGDLNPLYTFQRPGLYVVSLTVAGPSGNSSYSAQINVQSAQAPVANFNFNPTTGTAPLTVAFTDASTGQINSWFWTFSDGTSSTERNPIKTFNNAGTYNVFLTVSGAGGAANVVKAIVVNAPNVTATPNLTQTAAFQATLNAGINAGVAATQTQNALNAQATQNSINATATQNALNAGNAATATQNALNATATQDAANAQGTSVAQVSTQQSVDATATQNSLNATTAANDALATQTQDAANAQATAQAIFATQTQDALNAANAVVFATQTQDAINAANAVVFATQTQDAINAANAVVFATQTQDAINAANAVVFATQTQDAINAANAVVFATQTQDAINAANAVVFATQTQDAINAANAVVFATQTQDAINAASVPPTANFTAVPGADGLSLQFNDASSNAVAYSWDFGDGTTSADANPYKSYLRSGTYNVTLIVTNANGVQSAPFSQQVSVQRPQSAVDFQPAAPNFSDPNVSQRLVDIYNSAPADQRASVNLFGRTDSGILFGNLNSFSTDGNGNPNYNLGENGFLQGAIDQFGTSFSNSPVCSADVPFNCNFGGGKPAVLLIAPNYNNATEPFSFGANLQQSVQGLLDQGVIPVLFTVAPVNNGQVSELLTASINEQIINVANSLNVPLINTWGTVNGLPNSGLAGDGVSLNPSFADKGAGNLSNSELNNGANAVNFAILSLLSNLTNSVLPNVDSGAPAGGGDTGGGGAEQVGDATYSISGTLTAWDGATAFVLTDDGSTLMLNAANAVANGQVAGEILSGALNMRVLSTGTISSADGSYNADSLFLE